MKLDHCPHCHTRSGLTDYFTLLLSLENWPLALLYSMLVIAFGNKLEFGNLAISLFIFAAIAPLAFHLVRKQSCENCGMEFKATDGKDGIKSVDPLL
ncbi:MAG: hypothetical protein J5J00_03305 [Deltaproteobacteria bacterium]|nr:hypothetical protein [Deltaproteobacteria bacterium]